MKNKIKNIVFAYILLAGFVFVQIPFSFFHQHEHLPQCILQNNDLSKKHHSEENTDNAHFHDHIKPCFACSANLTNVFTSSNPIDFSLKTSFKNLSFSSEKNPVLELFSSKSTRAPPAVIA